MAEALKGMYNRRHPERTDYYRIIEGSFEEFQRSYPDQFEEKYGYLRTEVMKAVYSFLECGIPENGMARVRCEECGHDFFVAYSCRCRVACPSCSTKRSVLFGEKVRVIVKPVSHLHITFTIPKILRAYFRRNRKLLKFLVQSANWTIEKYFTGATEIEGGYTGGIYCIHSHGSLFNYHPHLHALVPAGIMKDGVFYGQRNISNSVIAEIFRARLLTVLLKQGVIKQELINMLMSWNHHSGFNVHVRGQIDGADGDAIENIARYMSRAAISVDRVEFNPADNTLTVYERKDRPSSGMNAAYTIMEFMALLACHIPSPYESLVYYYGIYSSSHRGKERRENRDDRGIEIQERKGTGKASSTWARLIHRIFEVNPLQCTKCGGNMRVVAFITDYQTSKSILKHIREETIRSPPLRVKTPITNIPDTVFWDSITPVESYFHNPGYAN